MQLKQVLDEIVKYSSIFHNDSDDDSSIDEYVRELIARYILNKGHDYLIGHHRLSTIIETYDEQCHGQNDYEFNGVETEMLINAIEMCASREAGYYSLINDDPVPGDYRPIPGVDKDIKMLINYYESMFWPQHANFHYNLDDFITPSEVYKVELKKLRDIHFQELKSSLKTVIFSHGKEGSPNGSKAEVIKSVARNHLCRFISIDYSQCNTVEERVEKLLPIIDNFEADVILVGSSMGGYVSLVASMQKEVRGLFLIAPALYMKGYTVQEYSPQAETISVRHGWNDEIIPYQNSIKFCEKHKAKLELLDDNHRMSETMEDLKGSFKSFIKAIMVSV